MIPNNFTLFNLLISTNSVFLVIGVFISLFVFWHEMRRDGFDEEKTLDLFFICIISGFLLSRFTFSTISQFTIEETLLHMFKFWEPGYNMPAMAAGLLVPIYLFSKFWRWSLYRMNDAFVLSFSVSLAFLFGASYLVTSDTRYIVGLVFYSVLYYLLFNLRLSHRSGLVFTLFMFFTILFGLTFYRSLMYLIFYAVFLTIGLVNFHYWRKRSLMKTNLSASFIDRMKQLLSDKEKQLKIEQQNLMSEDPYLKPGHQDVEEYLDDVNDDIEKEVHDMRLNSIKAVKRQVRKALAYIGAGKYGVCEVCGEPINKERLNAYPEATTCVKHSK